MTPEDEEFNRIEMESRIKQEYIRAMRKTTREEKISNPAVYEVPANNRMIALMEELAIAKVCIRELGDRLAKLEKENGVPVGVGGRLTTTSEQEPVEWGVDWGKDGNSVSIIKRLADGNIEVLGWEYAPHPPQRTWVGLTDEEIADCAEKMEASDPTDSFWREFFRGIEAKLKEKNT